MISVRQWDRDTLLPVEKKFVEFQNPYMLKNLDFKGEFLQPRHRKIIIIIKTDQFLKEPYFLV